MIDVLYDSEDFWLTKKTMSELFDYVETEKENKFHDTSKSKDDDLTYCFKPIFLNDIMI